MRVIFNTSYWYFSKFSNYYQDTEHYESEYWDTAEDSEFEEPFNEYPISVVSFMNRIYYWNDRVI